MKFITIFGAGLLAFSGSFALSGNVFAVESTEETIVSETAPASTKPTQAELRSVITRAESLPNYHEYSLLSAEELANTTNLFREYTYLFKVVNIAKDFDANYGLAPAEDLAHIIKITDDATVVCSLLFGSTNQNSSTSAAEATQTPSVSTPKPATTQAVATTSKPQTSTPVVTTQATPVAPTATQPETTTIADNSEPAKSDISTEPKAENSNDDIAVPTTGTAEKSNKPLFITLGAVALASFLIGSMIILNRKKSYRPGRKF